MLVCTGEMEDALSCSPSHPISIWEGSHGSDILTFAIFHGYKKVTGSTHTQGEEIMYYKVKNLGHSSRVCSHALGSVCHIPQ